MGIVSATWRHAIEGHALTIKEEIDHLRADIPQRSRKKVEERLAKIQRMAQLILDKPITPPLSKEEGVEPVPINDLLKERLKQLWENEPYRSVRLNLGKPDNTATVRASPAWLLRAFDVLLDNAVEAMASSVDPILTVSTRVANSHVEIIFADTGPGISTDVLARLFNQQIKKPTGAKGLGMGLLMAQTIAQTYGGGIQVEKTDQKGTIIVVSLPRETK
jgi:signal transduction histidine kinase